MRDLPIQRIWESSYDAFLDSGFPIPDVQRKASSAILNCKSGRLGYSVCQCAQCGHIQIHNNSCRSRSCPSCQAVKKEIWVDKRRAEVIDSPYFHVVFTLPHELNPLIYCNQKLLYGFFHRCCAETLLELSASRKHLGAVPGIIQVLHTWNQELGYHVHMHCIVSGGGLTPDHKIRTVKKNFFIRVEALRDKFKGKFLAGLQSFFRDRQLVFPASCEKLKNSYQWAEFRDSLYNKDWCPYIKETFNGFGNAIEYLGRYTHKVAISNSRILSVSGTHTTFSARGRKPGGTPAGDHAGKHGIHPPFPDACAPGRVPEDPLLRLPEQPDEVKKPAAYLYPAGPPEVPAEVYGPLHGGTAESGLEC